MLWLEITYSKATVQLFNSLLVALDDDDLSVEVEQPIPEAETSSSFDPFAPRGSIFLSQEDDDEEDEETEEMITDEDEDEDEDSFTRTIAARFSDELEELRKARCDSSNDQEDIDFINAQIKEMEDWLSERQIELDGLHHQGNGSSFFDDEDEAEDTTNHAGLDISGVEDGASMDVDYCKKEKKRTLAERDEEGERNAAQEEADWAAQEALLLLAAGGHDTSATGGATVSERAMVPLATGRRQSSSSRGVFAPTAPTFVLGENVAFLPDDDDQDLFGGSHQHQEPPTKRKNLRLLK